MLGLIKNEISNMIFKKKTLITLVCFTALIILLGFGLHERYITNSVKPVDYSGLNAVNYIEALFQLLGMVFLGLILAILASDKGLKRAEISQTVSKSKILLSKYISRVLTSVFIICLMEILAFLVFGLIFGFGNMNTPVLVHEKFISDLYTAHEIPTYKLLLQAMLMQILFIIATVSFVFMLSTVLKKALVAMNISIIVIAVVTILQNALPLTNKLASCTFLIYGSPIDTLTGGYTYSLGVPYTTKGYIFILLIVWSILSYIVAHLVFVKRDVLI